MTRSVNTINQVFTKCLLIGACIVFLSSKVLAGHGDEMLPTHAFEMGLGTSYYEYEEPEVDLKVDGFMYEVVGSYTYHDNLMIHGDIEYGFGDLDYDGAYLFSGFPAKTDVESWKVEGRLLIGYDHMFGGKHTVTPFFGIGYHYWNGDSKGAGGYEREIEYRYSPIGLKTHSPLSNRWTWGMTLEYDLFWHGEVKAHIYDDFPDLDQDSGYGARISFRFNRPFADTYSVSIEPYIMYWDIDQSEEIAYNVPEPFPGLDVLIYAYEPANTTTYCGIRIVLEF